MKKRVLITFVLAMLMMSTLCVVRADDFDLSYVKNSESYTNAGFFPAALTRLIDYSISEWFSSGVNRALVTTTLCYDLLAYDQNLRDSIALINPTFVAVDDDDSLLTVVFQRENDAVLVSYLDSFAFYCILDTSSADETELALTSSCKDCKRNESSDLLMAAYIWKNALGK